MPTYNYSCDNCGHDFEREQRITEAPIKKCPQCGKLKARRMIAGGGFILKGGGWESDLYSGPSNRSGSASKTAKNADSTGPTKTADSTAAATPSASPKTGTGGKADS
ncbi:MAG: zinc ribbon domain-containing protein [Polyangiales bacterium]